MPALRRDIRLGERAHPWPPVTPTEWNERTHIPLPKPSTGLVGREARQRPRPLRGTQSPPRRGRAESTSRQLSPRSWTGPALSLLDDRRPEGGLAVAGTRARLAGSVGEHRLRSSPVPDVGGVPVWDRSRSRASRTSSFAAISSAEGSGFRFVGISFTCRGPSRHVPPPTQSARRARSR